MKLSPTIDIEAATIIVAGRLRALGTLKDDYGQIQHEKVHEALKSIYAAPPAEGAPTSDDASAWEIFDYARKALLQKGCSPEQAEAAGVHAAVIAARELEPRTPAETADVRWAVNVLLEKVATKFEAWETMDLWRSDAASTVRSFKHDLAASSSAQCYCDIMTGNHCAAGCDMDAPSRYQSEGA
jgi:hypothetical protein